MWRIVCTIVVLTACKSQGVTTMADAGSLRVDGGHVVGIQKREINMIAGTGIGISVSDNSTTGQADTTISNTAVGGVSSVTGSSGVNCSPTTGAVACTNTGATSVTGTSGVLCSPTTGAVSCSNTGVTSVGAGNGLICSPTTGSAVCALATPVVVSNGGTGVTSGSAHGIPVWEGTGSMNTTGASCSANTFLGCNVGSDPTFQAPGTPSTIVSAVAIASGGTITLSGSYQTLTSITMTNNGVVDCHGDIEWEPAFTGSALTVSWGISDNSTSAPADVRSISTNAPGQNMMGAMVERFTVTGSRTYRVLAEFTGTGTISQNVALGDLLCLTH